MPVTRSLPGWATRISTARSYSPFRRALASTMAWASANRTRCAILSREFSIFSHHPIATLPRANVTKANLHNSSWTLHRHNGDARGSPVVAQALSLRCRDFPETPGQPSEAYGLRTRREVSPTSAPLRSRLGCVSEPRPQGSGGRHGVSWQAFGLSPRTSSTLPEFLARSTRTPRPPLVSTHSPKAGPLRRARTHARPVRPRTRQCSA